MSDRKTQCANCGAERPESQLDYISDFFARTEPGEEIPAGQCPEPDCGACCFIVKPEPVTAAWRIAPDCGDSEYLALYDAAGHKLALIFDSEAAAILRALIRG